jgi:DNA-binding MarR family transcriptional regulator
MSRSAGVGSPTFDETFATLPRLKVAAFLSGCERAEFGVVAAACELTDSTLSKAMTALQQTGYVLVKKGYVGKRPRTWLSLTSQGRRALAGHLGAVAALAGEGAGPPIPE